MSWSAWVRMLVVHVCVCVCLQQWDKDDKRQVHTHAYCFKPGGLKKQNKFTFSDMSRFYELKHCDGRDDFYHWGVFFFFSFLECWQWTPDFTMTWGPIVCVCVCVCVCVRMCVCMCERWVCVSWRAKRRQMKDRDFVILLLDIFFVLLGLIIA